MFLDSEVLCAGDQPRQRDSKGDICLVVRCNKIFALLRSVLLEFYCYFYLRRIKRHRTPEEFKGMVKIRCFFFTLLYRLC